MEPESFRHEPIDTRARQIRLVIILPTVDGIVLCSIKAFDLDGTRTPDYRALSYTWGPPSPVQAVELNGKLFLLRQNLYDFMDNFRARLVKFSGHGYFEEEVQWLWIDQICIDQTTVKERNHQVEMMSEIYRRASYVYLWLGASNLEIDTVVRAMKINFRLYHHRTNRSHINTDVKASIDNVELPLLSDLDLNTFFWNPYWVRLWIVQEVMLARYIRIFYGDTIVSWEELKRFCTIYSNVPKQLRWLAENAQTGQTFSFSILFDIFGDNLCEDPSDKVYALLGIVHPEERVKVDYAKPSYNKFVQAVYLILPRKPQSHPNLFKAVQEHDYKESPNQIFMNTAMAMMSETRKETRLRIMDAILLLASQMHVNLRYEHDKEVAKGLDDELKNHWTDLAQAYATLYAKDAGQDREWAWKTRSESCELLVEKYQKAVEMTTSFFNKLPSILNQPYWEEIFVWRTRDNLLSNMDAVLTLYEQSQ